MNKLYICNVFTLQMLDHDFQWKVNAKPIELVHVKSFMFDSIDLFDRVDAIGHSATVQVLNERFGWNLRPNRYNVKLDQGDVLIVCEVSVPRLAEGQVLSAEEIRNLPIQFWRVQVRKMYNDLDI